MVGTFDYCYWYQMFDFNEMSCFVWMSNRHAEVMKKIIETVAEGGSELGVHVYPLFSSIG